jgi:sterol desaturase/sphingolipid hydroxylase (fatty acid hydroxylase superfamily)
VTAILQAVKDIYAPLPTALGQGAVMIVAFTLLGIGFYCLCVPGRRLSLIAALAHVFKAEFYRENTARVDRLHFALAMLFWMPLTTALIAGFSIDTRVLLAARFGARAAMLPPGVTLAVLQFLVILLARDFGAYVGHWLLHKVPLLWSVHRTHHSAEALTFFTSVRIHPLEYLHMQAFAALFGGLGGGAFLYLTGSALHAAPLAMLMAAGIFFESFGLAQHSHLPISFGRLNRLLVSPVMHQMHHSAELRHRDKNLGTQFAIFDWLFGTLYLPEKGERWRLGLNDDELGARNPHIRLRDFYAEPFRHAGALLRGKGRAVPEKVTGPAPV